MLQNILLLLEFGDAPDLIIEEHKCSLLIVKPSEAYPSRLH